MQWHKCIIIVQKLTMVVELWALFLRATLLMTVGLCAQAMVDNGETKGPRRFCPHRSDCCLALMLMCQNSPLWQGSLRCNNVFVLAAMTHSNLILDQCGHHVTCVNWNEPLWTMLEYELVDANGVFQGIQKVRVEHATRSVVATWCNVVTSLHSW